MQQFNCYTCAVRCAGTLSCWNTKSLPDTLHIADINMTSRSSIEEVSKRYQQNILLCNNNEITTCIADIFTSFCEEVYAVEFFKVVRRQIWVKWEIQFFFKVKELLKSDNICKNYVHIKRFQFFMTRSVES